MWRGFYFGNDGSTLVTVGLTCLCSHPILHMTGFDMTSEYPPQPAKAINNLIHPKLGDDFLIQFQPPSRSFGNLVYAVDKRIAILDQTIE